MKKELKFNITLNNRTIYTFITFAVFLLIAVGVFAFGTSTPSTFGHSAKELDLSAGVDGDVVFRGNLDVDGSVKIGTSATCNSDRRGSIRYDSVNDVLELCDSADWKSVSTISTVVGDITPLVNGVHTSQDCTGAGGIVEPDGAGNFMCKFAQASCPSGWTSYNDWTATVQKSCDSQSGECGNTCTTPSHPFGNIEVDTCIYAYGCVIKQECTTVDYEQVCGPVLGCAPCAGGHTCTATVINRGCY